VGDAAHAALLALGSFGQGPIIADQPGGGREMETDQQRAVTYIQRALELRKKARALFDLKAQQALLNEATDFERMAVEITENLARKNSK
jgi:hypothetical protein